MLPNDATDATSDSSTSDAALIGGIVGGIVAALLIAAVIAAVLIVRRRRDRASEAADEADSNPPTVSTPMQTRIEASASAPPIYDTVSVTDLTPPPVYERVPALTSNAYEVVPPMSLYESVHMPLE